MVLFSSVLLEPSAEATCGFSDDFSDGDFAGWSEGDSDGAASFWIVTGGELQGNGDATNSTNGGEHDSILLWDTPCEPDLTLDVDLRYIAGTANPGDGATGEQTLYVFLRYSDPDNYIYLKISPVNNTSSGGMRPDIAIKEVVDGDAYGLDVADIYPTNVPPSNPSSVVSHLKVTLADLLITLEFDGEVEYEEYLPFVNRGAGRIGLGVPDGSNLISRGVSQFPEVCVNEVCIFPPPAVPSISGFGIATLGAIILAIGIGFASQHQRGRRHWRP